MDPGSFAVDVRSCVHGFARHDFVVAALVAASVPAIALAVEDTVGCDRGLPLVLLILVAFAFPAWLRRAGTVATSAFAPDSSGESVAALQRVALGGLDSGGTLVPSGREGSCLCPTVA